VTDAGGGDGVGAQGQALTRCADRDEQRDGDSGQDRLDAGRVLEVDLRGAQALVGQLGQAFVVPAEREDRLGCGAPLEQRGDDVAAELSGSAEDGEGHGVFLVVEGLVERAMVACACRIRGR
jgi:hypothetical protein